MKKITIAKDDDSIVLLFLKKRFEKKDWTPKLFSFVSPPYDPNNSY